MTHKCICKIVLLTCSLTLFSAKISAAIVVTAVNEVEVSIGMDQFRFSKSTGVGNFFFFGNQTLPTNGSNQNTADRVTIGSGQQYFQAGTTNLTVDSFEGSTFAYLDFSGPVSGASTGRNFSAYDVDQNGVVDTLFLLDFGPDLTDFSDDVILAYASSNATSPLDLFDARAALIGSVPEPSSSFLLFLSGYTLVLQRRKN